MTCSTFASNGVQTHRQLMNNSNLPCFKIVRVIRLYVVLTGTVESAARDPCCRSTIERAVERKSLQTSVRYRLICNRAICDQLFSTALQFCSVRNPPISGNVACCACTMTHSTIPVYPLQTTTKNFKLLSPSFSCCLARSFNTISYHLPHPTCKACTSVSGLVASTVGPRIRWPPDRNGTGQRHYQQVLPMVLPTGSSSRQVVRRARGPGVARVYSPRIRRVPLPQLPSWYGLVVPKRSRQKGVHRGLPEGPHHVASHALERSVRGHGSSSLGFSSPRHVLS